MASTSRTYAPVRVLVAEDPRSMQPNWGLLLALGFNVVAWWGLSHLF